MSSSALMNLLALGLHIEFLRAVIDSYSVISLSAHLTPAVLLDNVTQVLAETSVLAVRLAGPFIVYGITMNVALGLANRFVPQISFYHVTTGVVMLLGLLLFRLIWPGWMMIFLDSYGFWLRRGGL